MRRTSVAALSAFVALMLVGVLGVAASAYGATPPLQVPDHPFSSCNVSGEPGTVYPDAEVEPWIAVNPTNSLHMIGVFQQDRWSNGGANGLVAAVTRDGGATWSTSWAPFSVCSGGNTANGGDWERATDPWVTFSPNGAAYQIADAFNASGPGFGDGSAILVSKSTDGGDTWGAPTTLIRTPEQTALNDKESITADPLSSQYVYAIWDRLVVSSLNANPIVVEHAIGYHGPTWFSRTTNGGQTWEKARVIYDPGTNNQTIASQIVVLPNGTLVNVFTLIFNFKNSHKVRGASVAVMRSTDHGATWSEPIIVDKIALTDVTDPNTGQPVRSGDIIPDIAVDRASGALYVVWQDNRFSGRSAVALSKSTDGGLHWSSPAAISTHLETQAFIPSVEVANDGTVGVTYYDFRNDTAAAPLTTDDWLIHSHDGGQTWAETHVGGPFDMATAPVAVGYFVGDYQGLAAIGNRFGAFFVMANDGNLGNRTDPFFSNVGP